MKKQGKRTLMPKLRFPEFTQEWRPATIGEVFNSDDRPVKATRFESDKILTVKLHTNGVVRNERTGALTGSANYFIRRAGQFIFSKIDLLNGAFGIVPKEFDGFCSSSDVPAFSFSTEQSPRFFLNWLTARYRRLDIERTGTSATLKRVSPANFWEIPILLPDPAEQQKIADCLSSLDGLIAAEGRKLEALKAHKKGLMQQLFPQPGETQPRLRFPEFRDKGEWKTIILGDVVSISKGKGVAKSDVVDGGKTPCIRYAELYTIYSEVITHVHSRTDVPVDMLLLSQEGDVIIPASGETKEDIATCGCVMNAGVALGSDLNVLRSDIDGRFFSYYLNGVQRRELAKVAQGDTVAHLYPAQISQLSISIAPEPYEQQRIANCLSTLDAQIAAQAAKIEALKQHKHGLMQQLFPAPEEQ